MYRPQRWAVVVSGCGLLWTLLIAGSSAAQTPGAPGDTGADAAPGTTPSAGVAPPAATAPAPPAVEVTAPVDRRAGWRHEFSPAWHMSTFSSEHNQSQYTFHSVSLGYVMSVNARGPFLHLSFVLPLQARQDGRVHSVSSIYQNAGGLDVLVGWQWRYAIGEALEIEAGPGFHINALNLGGKPGLTNFNALQFGGGGMTSFRWRPGYRPGKANWTIGVLMSVAIDIYDPLRSNDLNYGVATRFGAVVGVDLP